MITHRQIKSRFTKRHLTKVVKDMLAWRLGTDETKPLLELRSGFTPDKVAEQIDSVRIVESTKDAKTTILVEISLKDQVMVQTLKILGPGFKNEGCCPCFAPVCTGETIDRWLYQVLRRDEYFKDNSAIPLRIW